MINQCCGCPLIIDANAEYRVKPASDGRVMLSITLPNGHWAAVYLTPDAWGQLKAVGDRQLCISAALNATAALKATGAFG